MHNFYYSKVSIKLVNNFLPKCLKQPQSYSRSNFIDLCCVVSVFLGIQTSALLSFWSRRTLAVLSQILWNSYLKKFMRTALTLVFLPRSLRSRAFKLSQERNYGVIRRVFRTGTSKVFDNGLCKIRCFHPFST